MPRVSVYPTRPPESPVASRDGYTYGLIKSPRRIRPRSQEDGLRTLSLRLETAREEERARLARELHDELGQVLTSLKLEFMWLVDELGKSEPKPGNQLANKLQSLAGLNE